MGKIRTRILGYEDVEKEQKEEQKRRSAEKKTAKKGEKAAFAKVSAAKHKIRAQGLKGGERMTQIEVSDEAVEKMDKAKKIIAEQGEPASVKASAGKERKKIKARVRGNNYKKAKKEIERNSKNLELDQAIKLLKKVKFAKFDESIELHLVVNKTGLKGEVELPHSSGKQLRIAVVDDKLLEKIEKGKLDFDVLITHPSFMPKLARFAKTLGPKGLMPNPKAGTISTKPEEVVKKFSKGVLRWKTEAKAPLIHQMVGKISFAEKDLQANSEKFIESVGLKNILRAFIKTTMSPSIKITLES